MRLTLRAVTLSFGAALAACTVMMPPEQAPPPTRVEAVPRPAQPGYAEPVPPSSPPAAYGGSAYGGYTQPPAYGPPLPPPPPPPPAGSAYGGGASGLEGHWSGDFGHMLLRNVGGRIMGAYTHDQGTVVGSLSGGVFTGWWCETPTRRPDHDAGRVEGRLVQTPQGPILDGRWSYGAGEWHEDWDLRPDPTPVPAELEARLRDPSAFCQPGAAAPPTLATPPALGSIPLDGHWSGSWGHALFRNVSGQIMAVYQHDQGTLVGILKRDQLKGWWCEAPTREPDHDAGRVEGRLVQTPQGPFFDGRWSYGTGEWHEDWDLRPDPSPVPPELEARLRDPSGFCSPPPAVMAPALGDAAAQPTAPEILGHWSGGFGHLVLRQSGAWIMGAYSHDQGTVLGTFSGGVFRGWWTEVPSRRPTNDAGEVELRLRQGAGGWELDGRWRYGAQGEWREDWDLSRDPAPVPPELDARFGNASAFRPHP